MEFNIQFPAPPPFPLFFRDPNVEYGPLTAHSYSYCINYGYVLYLSELSAAAAEKNEYNEHNKYKSRGLGLVLRPTEVAAASLQASTFSLPYLWQCCFHVFGLCTARLAPGAP